MSSPSFEDERIAMFDSFCKEVSRNFIKDLARKEERRMKLRYGWNCIRIIRI